MLEKIESTFRDLISSLQTARLYDESHPQFMKSIDKAFVSFQEALRDREEFVIGIVGEELAFEKNIFFNLSKTVNPIILYLKERGIEIIGFHRGIKKEELSKFVAFLARKEETKSDPQASLESLGIRNIRVGKIKAVSAEAVSAEEKKVIDYLGIYDDSMGRVTNSLEGMLDEQEINRLSLRITVTSVMDNLSGRYQEFLNLATLKRYDVKTFSHIINVSILAMYISSKIGFAKEDVLDIGTAAIFHDIGKIYISRKIITKPDKLTTEEFSKIKSHVIVGTEILLKYVDSLGILPAVVCFEHHLKYDLSGYPKLDLPRKLHLASMIVCICDVYDALSQRRAYKNDYPPQMIYDIMMKERGKTFEPQLLDEFFKVMGVWPVGTIVVLNDGRIAVVREENEDDIFCPKVEIVVPQGMKETINLREEKGRIKIERFLNPVREGREYLNLI